MRIARVLSPRTFSTSGRAALLGASFDQEWASLDHEVKTFVYSDARIRGPVFSIQSRTFYLSGQGLRWLLKLAFLLLKGEFDLFVISTATPEYSIAFIVGKLLRRKMLVLESHWWWPKSLLARLWWPIARHIAHNATVLAVAGKRVKEFWTVDRMPNDKMRIHHCYYSRIHASCECLDQVEKRKDVADRINVLFFGRLLQPKGVDVLLRAFPEIESTYKNIVLSIVGEGPERARLEQLSKELGLTNVIFEEAVYDDERKAAVFLASDIVVLPSLSTVYPEEWGLVVNEALSIGKPVIVSKAVGCAYDLVIDGVNGYIVPENDSGALARAIIAIAGDPHLRARMGKASLEIVKHYDYIDALKSLNEIIDACFVDAQAKMSDCERQITQRALH